MAPQFGATKNVLRAKLSSERSACRLARSATREILSSPNRRRPATAADRNVSCSLRDTRSEHGDAVSSSGKGLLPRRDQSLACGMGPGASGPHRSRSGVSERVVIFEERLDAAVPTRGTAFRCRLTSPQGQRPADRAASRQAELHRRLARPVTSSCRRLRDRLSRFAIFTCRDARLVERIASLISSARVGCGAGGRALRSSSVRAGVGRSGYQRRR